MKTIALLFVLAISLNSCKNSNENISSSGNNESVAAATKTAVDPLDQQSEEAESDQKPEAIAPMLIKEGNLRFETSDIDNTFSKIQEAAKSSSAIIESDIEGKDNQSVFRNITVRIPSKNFDEFVKQVSNGITYFDRKEISSKDVTADFIDVDARIKAKTILENRYFELLKKANKVSEMIEIENQLATIREEIDVKKGQLQYLKNRIAMSTVSIEFYKSVANESGATISFWNKLWTAIASGFNNATSFFILIVQLWPFIAIFVVGFYFIRKRTKK